MTDQDERNKRRVILAASCFADANSAINVAVNLATQVRGDLFGVFVKEEIVRRYMTTAQTTIVIDPSGMPRPVTPALMDNAFQRDAEAFERQLSSAARKAAVAWSFKSLDGALLSTLGTIAEGGDLILLGYRQLRRAHGDVIVVIHEPAIAPALLDLGSEIAHDLRRAMKVVMISDSEDTQRRIGEIRSQLTRSGVSGVAVTAVKEWKQALDFLQYRTPTVVLSSLNASQTAALRALVESARAPVIISVGDDSR